MKLFSDIKSRKLLILKGLLFLFVTMISGAGLLLKSFQFDTVLLLVIFAWSACRFYYFLFYVLEKYAGRNRKYAGIFDELKHLVKKGKN